MILALCQTTFKSEFKYAVSLNNLIQTLPDKNLIWDSLHSCNFFIEIL